MLADIQIRKIKPTDKPQKLAVTSLMIPCNDLHMVNRDELGCLLGYLTDRLHKTTLGGG